MTSRKRSWLPRTERARCCGTTCGAGFAALEEVAEEDGVDVVFRVGLECFAEALDVTLDVADDQGGSHALRIRAPARSSARCGAACSGDE
jgi:hypothetical protein